MQQGRVPLGRWGGCASYSQGRSKRTSELFFFVDDIVDELKLDVEADTGIDTLECFLQRAKRVICFDGPVQDSPVFRLPQQWFPHL